MGYSRHSLVNSGHNSLRQSSYCSSESCIVMMGRIAKEWMGEAEIHGSRMQLQRIRQTTQRQVIHGLNDKDMLGVIIKESTATKSNDHITSGNALAWEKRVEAQRTQAAVMNSITESKVFDKIKVSRPLYKDSPKRPAQSSTLSWQVCRYFGSSHPPRQCPVYGKMCTECNSLATSRDL